MTDIVERLMNRHCCQDNLDQEAAQEIERLRKELKKLLQKSQPTKDYQLNHQRVILVNDEEILNLSMLLPKKPKFSEGRPGGFLG
jgi:hypothetical protein